MEIAHHSASTPHWVRRLEGANGTKGCVAVASMMPPLWVARIVSIQFSAKFFGQKQTNWQ